MHASPSAAIILIGNELLSGKITDRNAAYLTRRLHGMGVQVQRVLVIPDDVDTIGAEVAGHAARYDHVFTSGGVGPTHDDVTVEGIAQGFGAPVVTHPQLRQLLVEHFGDRLTEAHLRMATMPEGSELLHGGELSWPILRCRNVYILPGVPELFRAKFETIASRFHAGEVVVWGVYVNADEGEIAATLAALEARFEVSVGSYPRVDRQADHRVKITVESASEAHVREAVAHLLGALAPGCVLRVEDGAGQPAHLPLAK